MEQLYHTATRKAVGSGLYELIQVKSHLGFTVPFLFTIIAVPFLFTIIIDNLQNYPLGNVPWQYCMMGSVLNL